MVTVLDPDQLFPAVPHAHVPSEETAAACPCLPATTSTRETPNLHLLAPAPPRGPAGHLEGLVEIAIPAA